MNDNRFYVYGLFDPKDDFPFYIGKGTGKRRYIHFCASDKGYNPHKDRKIEKIQRQGREPYAEKLYDNLPEDEAYMREWCLINVFYDRLTNLQSDFGDGAASGKDHPNYGKTFTHTEETKQKISEKVSGENNPNYGTTLSEEHKEAFLKDAHGKGENANRSKLSRKEAEEVKWLALHSDKTQREIGEEYGVTRYTVCRIKLEKNWKHIEARNSE